MLPDREKSRALRRRQMWLSASFICLSAVTPGLGGQADPALPHGTTITTDAAPRTAEIGDPIVIEVKMRLPAGSTIDVPQPESRIGDFSVLEFDTARIPSLPGEPERVARIIATVYRTGNFTFPSIPLRFKTVEGKEFVAHTEPFRVTIKSVLPSNNPDLKPPRRQIEMPAPIAWERWLGIGFTACLAAALAWTLWRRLRRKGSRQQITTPPPAPPKDLLDVAEAELRGLLEREPPTREQAKELHVALSGIIRRVLDAGYGMHTEEQTASEIMDALHRDAGADAAAQGLIESFLLRSDIVKFAKYVPSAAEHEDMAKDAYRILADARNALGRRAAVAIDAPPTNSTGK